MVKYRKYNNCYDKYKEGQVVVSNVKSCGNHSFRFNYKEILDKISVDSYIVDVGCRDGKFVKHIQDLGYKNTHGLDIGRESCLREHSKEWCDKYIQTADIQLKYPFEFKCDFINLSHTLEHFVEPDPAMVNLTSNLTDNGYMLIVVPSEIKDYPNKRIEDHNKYHWIFFEDEDDIVDYLSQFGLNVLSIKHQYEKLKNGQNRDIGEWVIIAQKK